MLITRNNNIAYILSLFNIYESLFANKYKLIAKNIKLLIFSRKFYEKNPVVIIRIIYYISNI